MSSQGPRECSGTIPVITSMATGARRASVASRSAIATASASGWAQTQRVRASIGSEPRWASCLRKLGLVWPGGARASLVPGAPARTMKVKTASASPRSGSGTQPTASATKSEGWVRLGSALRFTWRGKAGSVSQAGKAAPS